MTWLGPTLLFAAALAGDPLQPTRVETPPRLDGRLDDPVWARALVVDDFVQRAPSEGGTPSERTEVRVLYTATDLYLGLRAFDRAPDSIRATVMRRDNFELIQNDQFVVAIDSAGSGRAGYWFSTNPLGVRVDAQFFDEGDVWQAEWNGVWDCATSIDDQGWSAELRIPFATVRWRPGASVAGLNMFRRLVRTDEQLFAPLIPLAYANGTPNVSVARPYRFEGVAPGRDLRIRPNLRARTDWGATPAASADRLDAGLDVNLGVSDALLATLTFNTDFALADVDDRQLNLGRFSLFYPEKRDFFLEQGGLFAFGVPQQAELFFSRRIGLGDGAVARDLPFGAKLTGRLGPAEIGLLHVRASPIAGGAAQDASVARLRFGLGRSSFGLLATRLDEGGVGDATLGADANWYVHGETAVSGFVAANRRHGGAAWPGAWNLTARRGGERTSFRLAVTDVASGFDPGLGFVERPGTRRWDAQLQWPLYLARGAGRRLVPGFEAHRISTGAGTETWSSRAVLGYERRSEDSIRVYGGPARDRVGTPFSPFPAVVVPPGDYAAGLLGLRVASKPGRVIAAEVTLETAQYYGGSSRGLVGRLSWKPSRHLTASGQGGSTWVALKHAAFRADVAQLRLDTALDTRWGARALAQWDNASRDLGFDLRLNFLLREGTEAALVYGRRDDRDGGSTVPRARPAHALFFKLTWLFQP